jgi:hypothetical protein
MPKNYDCIRRRTSRDYAAIDLQAMLKAIKEFNNLGYDFSSNTVRDLRTPLR